MLFRSTRSPKSWRSLPNTVARSQCFRCPQIRRISMSRSGSGITPGRKAPTTATLIGQPRYANRCSQPSTTCKDILKKSRDCWHHFFKNTNVVLFIRGHVVWHLLKRSQALCGDFANLWMEICSWIPAWSSDDKRAGLSGFFLVLFMTLSLAPVEYHCVPG